ncbi:MAG: TrkA family potassium uptake protein [Ktedonobacterales bacterium]|nr:TrkA family potassium uptake protein [Ktedonobacterales bacterium]
MKIVILGCGRVGATLATLMSAEGHEITIIDQNNDAFSRLGKEFQGETVIGDGTDEDILRRAGLEDAGAFAAVTNGDNRNIMAAQVAKHIFGVRKVICRIYDPIRQETYNTLGLESISPTIVGAKLMRDALTNPSMRTTSATQSLAEGRSVPLTPLPRERGGALTTGR